MLYTAIRGYVTIYLYVVVKNAHVCHRGAGARMALHKPRKSNMNRDRFCVGIQLPSCIDYFTKTMLGFTSRRLVMML